MHPDPPVARTDLAEVCDREGQSDEEQDIIDRCLRGETAPYRTLVDRYQRRVRAITFRLVGSRQEAEELSQQAFVDAYDGLAGFRPGARFSSWLFRIAVNACKDYLKSKKRTERSLPDELPDGAGQFSAYIPDPERALESREAGARVARAIARLPLKYRVVLVLKDIEELPYEEIKAIVRRPLTTLKIRVVRARAMLRELLEEEER